MAGGGVVVTGFKATVDLASLGSVHPSRRGARPAQR
jgi:hypothetical protein